MKEKMLAINSQNIYAGNDTKSMIDTLPEAEQVAAEKAGNKTKLANNEKTQEEVEKAIREAAREKLTKEQQKLAEAKGGVILSRETVTERSSQEATTQEVEMVSYFPQLPSNPVVYKEMQASFQDLKGKPLETVATTNIIKCYVGLRGAADAQGVNDLQFLSEIKRVLENRGVNPNAVYQASKEAYVKVLKQEWYRTLSSEEKNNPDVLSTIKVAAEHGYVPKGSIREEVIETSLLSDDKRLEKADKLLGYKLSEEQKTAILKAHYAGKGELGIDGKPAGVYNYTREQLRQKVEILEAAGFNNEQRRLIIEAGIAAESIPTAGITHPSLSPIIENVNEEAARLESLTPPRDFNPDYLEKQIDRIEKLIDQGAFAPGPDLAQAQGLIRTLNQSRHRAYEKFSEEREKQRPEGLWQTLRRDDFDLLSKHDYETFVNKWFDALYEAAAGRDPITSGTLGNVEKALQEAETYLTTVKPDLEGLAKLSDIFETRIKLLTMNWGAISSKSIESIQKGSFGLRAHGLLMGATLDKGYTGMMFNRITELLEDERLKLERGHLTPDLASSIQEMVIEEALSLRGNFQIVDGKEEYVEGTGVGIHAGKGRKAIERAVRSAYDMMVDSQRMHIIAARGKELFGADAFFSDAGAAFKVFNPKTFVSEKWGIFTPTDQRFLREVVEKSLIDEWLESKKETYGRLELNEEQRKELGDLLFKTMDSPPDFFSSGWRIKGMKTSLQKYFEHRILLGEAQARYADGRYPKAPDEFTTGDWNNFKHQLKQENRERTYNDLVKKAEAQAGEFGLFIRLKTASGSERLKCWEKIQEYRPEEIVRLLREKLSHEEMVEVNRTIFGRSDSVKSYDDFKKEFGAVLRAIREEGFRGEFNDSHLPEQINFAHMSTVVRNKLVAAIGEEKTQKIEKIYKNMQGYIKNNNIAYKDTGRIDSKGNRILTPNDTLFDKDYRFADLYDKTLVTDDLLLGNLEALDKKQKAFGMLELSKKWANDSGGDAYVRNMNDLAAGHAYTDELIGFIKETNEEEKFKHAEAVASKASDYNGRFGQAKALRHTIVPYMWASMPPGFYDTLGIKQLPFRIKMTKIEDIYGPHAKPLTQDERREMLDKIEAKLEAAIQNELDQLQFELEENKRKLQNLDTLAVGYEEQKEKLEHAISEYPKKVREARERGLKFRHSAEQLLQVRTRDLVRQKIIALFLFLLLAGLAEGTKVLQPGKG